MSTATRRSRAAPLLHDEHGAALVQVGTKSKHLGPADRTRLVIDAHRCSALPLLAVCAPGGPPKFYLVTALETPSKWERWTV